MTQKEAVSDVIDRHLHSAPINLEAMARDLGINVYFEPMAENVSGRITRNAVTGGPSGYSIHINAGHHANRQRFTLAHELAHFAMHRDLMGNSVTDTTLYRSSELSDQLERQANVYAAMLILPAPLVRLKHAEFSGDLHRLAQHFRVSHRAMEIRLEELGLDAPRGLSTLRRRRTA